MDEFLYYCFRMCFANFMCFFVLYFLSHVLLPYSGDRFRKHLIINYIVVTIIFIVIFFYIFVLKGGI